MEHSSTVERENMVNQHIGLLLMLAGIFCMWSGIKSAIAVYNDVQQHSTQTENDPIGGLEEDILEDPWYGADAGVDSEE